MSILHKHLRWGVIGAPSSGKTYLLSDLIQAFEVMGFRQEPLPLAAPYNSFGAFFAEISGVNGSLPQTDRYASRSDDRYGAVFAHPNLPLTIEVDFLNLPGETFFEGSGIANFSQLRSRISNISNSVFVLDTYTNPAGRERRILRYNEKRQEEDKAVQPYSYEMRHSFYMDRQHIYAELRADGYALSKSTPINGPKLLKRFFEIEVDSFYDTMLTCWQRLFPDLSLADFKASNAIYYFYPLLYCTQATDIIICDKLFVPKVSDGALESADSYNFDSLIQNVGDFVKSQKDHHPHVYLAFRGADFMLHRHEDKFRQYVNQRAETASMHQLRHEAYSHFCTSLLEQLYGQPADSSSGAPASTLRDCADIRPEHSHSLSGMDLRTHLDTRFGGNLGNGFWHLLNKIERRSILGCGGRDISTVFNSPHRPMMPPHVYFTATPIDEHFCLYRNDPEDVSRFIHEGKDKIRVFHIETAVYGVKSMCWGSFQLLEDILCGNRVPSPTARYATPLLNYCKGK